MRFRVLWGEVAACVATCLVIPAIAVGIAVEVIERTPEPVPACAAEDSPGPCFWDADEQGNGQGRSFLVTEDGAVIYTENP